MTALSEPVLPTFAVALDPMLSVPLVRDPSTLSVVLALCVNVPPMLPVEETVSVPACKFVPPRWEAVLP